MKKSIIIFGVVIFLGLVAGGINYFFEKLSPSEQNSPEIQTAHSPCLGDDEVATYEVKKKKRNLGDAEADG